MAIEQALCSSYKKELLTGTHDFSSDTFKIALYTSDASLGAATTAYTATGEVANGNGYTTGGATLVLATAPTLDGTKAYMDWDDPVWSSSTITAAGALIYNDTAPGDPAIAVISFGAEKSSSSSDFTVQLPAAGGDTAIVRVE